MQVPWNYDSPKTIIIYEHYGEYGQWPEMGKLAELHLHSYYWWIPCVAAKNIIKISDMGGKNCWLTMVYYQWNLLAWKIRWHVPSHKGRTADRGDPGDVLGWSRKVLGDGVNFRVDVLGCCTLSRNRLIAVKRKKSWIKMTFLNQDIYWSWNAKKGKFWITDFCCKCMFYLV